MDAQISGEPEQLNDSYNQTNLFSYFIALCILLIPLAIVGYLQLKDQLLKICLIVALVGSMTWLVFPHANVLVADRWILLFGISLSVFAGYGFVRTIQILSKWQRSTNLCILTTAMIFLIFAQIGISYAMLPYNAQASIISLFETNIQDFVPKSMQFNSVRIDQSPMLQDIINWLNENTSTRSKIIGSSDWRGWFVSGLAGNRGFIGYEELEKQVRNTNYWSNDQEYLIDTNVIDDPILHRTNSGFEGVKAYSNSLFTIYRIFEIPKNASFVN